MKERNELTCFGLGLADIQLRKLHASLESLVAQRRELVSNTAQFAKSCALLSNAEEHTGE